jgi:hypothetical protein
MPTNEKIKIIRSELSKALPHECRKLRIVVRKKMMGKFNFTEVGGGQNFFSERQQI